MTVIQLRRGNASQWGTVNPVLAQGEPGIELDTGRRKMGDGSTAWNALGYEGTQPYVELVRDTAGRVALSVVQGVVSPVNNVSIASAAAGGSPTLSVVGPGTNIDLTVQGKGSGRVQLPAATLTLPVLWSPRIDVIKDSNNANILSLPTQNNAVNYANITNAATGASPSLYPWGENDVGLNIFGRGTGRVTITNLSAANAFLSWPRIIGGLQSESGSSGITLTDGFGYGMAIFRAPTGVASANHLYFDSRVSGQAPAITAWGSDADVGLALTPKGIARVTVNNLTATGAILSSPTITTPNINSIRDANGNQSIALSAATSAVNFFFVNNSATGSNVGVGVWGADSNIGLNIDPRGTGRVTVTRLSTAAPIITGAIYDTNGNPVLNMAPIASAVNYLQIVNNIAGAPPQIQVNGPDTSISLLLRPRGPGNVQIYAETGQSPTIQAVGADTNHSIGLQSKGTGALTFRAGDGALSFWVQPAASAVNFLVIGSGGTGQPASIAVGGSTEANANLNIAAKGTGVINAQSMITDKTYTTAGRPAANTVPAGTRFFNTTTKKPNYSDGTNWYDAAGVAA